VPPNLEKPTILVVDDAPENIYLLNAILHPHYQVKAATSGAQALELTAQSRPDLILLDVMMPEMNGYEVCQRLKSSNLTRQIPIIFVTALNEAVDESKGFEVGAVDYITKPVNGAVVRARVKTHLMLYDQNRALEEKVRERTEELANTQEATIIGFATLAEFRNQETGAHIMRTQNYVRLLAHTLSTHPHFSDYLNPDTVELLYKSAPLHDIGKIAIPDNILLKPARLTVSEYEIIKQHATYGLHALTRAEQALGSTKSSFLRLAKEIAYSHHEHWDGSGYPLGLTGEAIPISGRLMALADVYDALVSERVYKQAFTHEKAVHMIVNDSGRQFDPLIVEAFFVLQGMFLNINQSITDLTGSTLSTN
jgi:putative two-component system response regulator